MYSVCLYVGKWKQFMEEEFPYQLKDLRTEDP